MIHPRLLAPLALALTCIAPACRSSAIARVPEGQGLLVLNKSDDTLSVIDPRSGDELDQLPVGVGPHEVAVREDGQQCVVANYGRDVGGNTLTVIDLARGRVERTIDLREHRRPHGIVYLDEATVLVTSETGGHLLVVGVEEGDVRHALPTRQDASHMVVASPDRRWAYVANIASGSITVFDLEAGELLAVVPTGAGSEGLDVTPDGKEIWVANRQADTVSVVDAATLEVVAEIDVSPDGGGPQPAQGAARPRSFPIRVKVTPDGGHALVSNAFAGDVAVLDVAARAIVTRIPMELSAVEEADERLLSDAKGPAPCGILMEPRGRYAFVANTNADIVTVIDLRDWTVAGRIPTDREPDGLGWATLPRGWTGSGFAFGVGASTRLRVGG